MKLGVQNLKIYLDSKLVSGNMKGIFEVKDKWVKIYCEKVTELMKHFRRIDIQAIKRELNVRVDGLAKGVAYGEWKKRKVMTTLDNN